MAYDFDLLTIGAGSGGVAGTRRAGAYGARTGIIQSLRVGGTCVLRGCVPEKLLVYGGYIAVEFAGIVAGAGVAVEISIRADRILRGFDGEVRTHLQAEMEKRGITFRTGVWPTAIARQGQGFRVSFNDGSTLDTDLVM